MCCRPCQSLVREVWAAVLVRLRRDPQPLQGARRQIRRRCHLRGVLPWVLTMTPTRKRWQRPMSRREPRPCQMQKKRKVYAVVRQEMRTISIAGMELRVKPRVKCHGIAVPLEGDYLLKILKHLRKRLYEGEVPEPDATKSERRKANLERRDDEDAGRIRWDFPTNSYQVVYEDAEGKQHKVAKPFKVPRTDPLGTVLDNKTFTAARVAALHKARAFWNKHDKSSLDRYEQANDTDTD